MLKPLTSQELMTMCQAGQVAADILKKFKFFLKAGISTRNIEEFFEESLSKYPEMEFAFKGYMGYPAACCVSVNEEIIHGIPSGNRLIKDGDLVSIDLGIKHKGLFVDTAYTYIVGKTTKAAKRLVKATLKALYVGIRQIKIGAKVGDVSWAMQKFVEKNGFSVIRKFVGHGIGRELHLAPEVPNFGEKGQGPILEEGFAIAVEPMVSAGSFEVDILDDGWTAKTRDNSLSAHFEHTIAITKNGPWILTA
jgi:methionyl aminopeptidase